MIPADLEETLSLATRRSLYTAEESLRSGWITAPGGLRIGAAGSLLTKAGEIAGFRRISSLCIRIPRAVPCVGDELLARLRDRSVLIYYRPGAGKTTFLRDLVRRLSDEGTPVGLADERGELAALLDGVPQLDVGENTDVLEGGGKAASAEMLLRAMAPRILAVDELSGADVPPLAAGVSAGARLLATAHAADRDELRRRGLPLALFDCLLRIELREGKRSYTVEETGC